MWETAERSDTGARSSRGTDRFAERFPGRAEGRATDRAAGRGGGSVRRMRAAFARRWARFTTLWWSRAWSVLLSPRRLAIAGLVVLLALTLASVGSVVAWKTRHARDAAPNEADRARARAQDSGSLVSGSGGPGRLATSPTDLDRIVDGTVDRTADRPFLRPRPKRAAPAAATADVRRPPLQIPVRGLTRGDLIDSAQ